VDIAGRDLRKGGSRRAHQEVADGDDALQTPFVVLDVEVVSPLSGRAEHAKVVDGLLDGDVLVEGDEAAAHEAAGRFVAVLQELRYFVAAIEGGEGFGALSRFELLHDVGNDIVFDLFEDGGEVLDADTADEVSKLIVFGVLKQLADHIAGQVIEEFGSLVFREIEYEFCEVGRVKAGYERDKFRPLAGFGKLTCIIEDFAGSDVFRHCTALRW
jgi:hypothetical protein